MPYSILVELNIKCNSLDLKEARENFFNFFKRIIYFIVFYGTSYLDEKNYERTKFCTIKPNNYILVQEVNYIDDKELSVS